MKNAGQLHGSLTVTNRFLELSCAVERKANLPGFQGVQRRNTLEKWFDMAWPDSTPCESVGSIPLRWVLNVRWHCGSFWSDGY